MRRLRSSRWSQALCSAQKSPAVAGRVVTLVVGSLNMDLVARCPHIPAPGETILGSDFTRSPGGKGANGATAAARLLPARMGGRVAMLGAVGRDDHGAALVRNLGARGVDAERVLRLDGVPTGVALIAVADDGENSIVVVPGANGHLRPEHVEAGLPALSPTVVLMQMEIPPQTVERAAALGKSMDSGWGKILDLYAAHTSQ